MMKRLMIALALVATAPIAPTAAHSQIMVSASRETMACPTRQAIDRVMTFISDARILPRASQAFHRVVDRGVGRASKDGCSPLDPSDGPYELRSTVGKYCEIGNPSEKPMWTRCRAMISE